MIQVDVEQLNQELVKLNHMIDFYEEIKDNLFKTITESSFFWNDNRAKQFYQSMNKEHSETQNMITNIKEMRDLFFFIITSYKELGKKIKCDIESKKRIMDKYSILLSMLDNIIQKYENLDVSFCPEERSIVAEQIKEYKGVKEKLYISKKRVGEYYESIYKIELMVKKKLSQLTISKITEFEIEQFY